MSQRPAREVSLSGSPALRAVTFPGTTVKTHLDLGRAQGEKDGYGVVGARVHVDEHGSRGGLGPRRGPGDTQGPNAKDRRRAGPEAEQRLVRTASRTCDEPTHTHQDHRRKARPRRLTPRPHKQ
jgi:hypothetical protein